MKSSDLKKLIKEYVKESLLEILSEEVIKAYVMKTLNESLNIKNNIINDRVSPNQLSVRNFNNQIPQIKQDNQIKKDLHKVFTSEQNNDNLDEKQDLIKREEKRREILRKIYNTDNKNNNILSESSSKYGLNNDIMKGIFEDTLNSNNPILSNENEQIAASSEEVSEDVLDKAGLFNKDWSKFI